jgi:hypothetical protein
VVGGEVSLEDGQGALEVLASGGHLQVIGRSVGTVASFKAKCTVTLPPTTLTGLLAMLCVLQGQVPAASPSTLTSSQAGAVTVAALLRVRRPNSRPSRRKIRVRQESLLASNPVTVTSVSAGRTVARRVGVYLKVGVSLTGVCVAVRVGVDVEVTVGVVDGTGEEAGSPVLVGVPVAVGVGVKVAAGVKVVVGLGTGVYVG